MLVPAAKPILVPAVNKSDTSTAAAVTGHRRRIAGLLATLPKLTPVPPDDPERNENHAIIAHLKNLISQDPKFGQIDFEPTQKASFFRVLRSRHGEGNRRFGGER
ncbi:hypothetical protein ACFX1R_007004 [Malus domestica]